MENESIKTFRKIKGGKKLENTEKKINDEWDITLLNVSWDFSPIGKDIVKWGEETIFQWKLTENFQTDQRYQYDEYKSYTHRHGIVT